MKKKFNRKRESRERTAAFRPNRAYIAQSIENFLRDGGRINQIILDEKCYRDFVIGSEPPSAVDEFLCGQ